LRVGKRVDEGAAVDGSEYPCGFLAALGAALTDDVIETPLIKTIARLVYWDTMNNFDFYAASAELASLLENDGHSSAAAKLRTAIEEGSTGTEILMALRYNLVEVTGQIPLKGNAQRMASRLLAELNNALE
jgi:hypothetical protein